MDVLLPWERLLWRGRSAWPVCGVRYVLTDLRLVHVDRQSVDEILLHDIADIARAESRLDRIIGSSTLTVASRDARRRPVVLRHIRRGPQLAALLEVLASDTEAADADAVRATLAWEPPSAAAVYAEALVGLATVLIAVFAAAIGLHGTSELPAPYAPDDPISPNGQKQSTEAIVRFMQTEVMPWARVALAPIKGGPDRVRCDTCHGSGPEPRGWQMPAVAALPQPDVTQKGWERYSGAMDAQMRNAIYGYGAQSDKQAKATYMREVVMPGMARLLHRPAYDFTKTYGYNRSHLAFGCYHCHKVK